MSRRRVKPEELELWHQVARTARRLHPEQPAKPQPLADSLAKKPPKRPDPARIEEFSLGEKATKPGQRLDVLPGISARIAATPVTMDKKAFTRLKRGKLVPEGKIDLHGMTMAQAHPALT
nr:DNA mismatch repair protein MutS [Roseovarius sp.]